MMKHTKGKWDVLEHEGIFYIRDEGGQRLASVKSFSSTEEAEANAKLIAEAGTVTNETGYTPRQLAEQKAELLEALKAAKAVLWLDYGVSLKVLDPIYVAIKKATP